MTTAFAAASIESILLKGPTIATWLYANDRPRLYADSDLLIQRSDWSKAQGIMRELGFADSLGQLAHPRMESGAGYPWARLADRAEVDLHCTLFGLGAEPEAVWDALFSSAEHEPIGGANVRTSSHPARLVHIALHAVQHGGEDQANPMLALERRPMVDLERAVTLVPLSTWVKARELAEQLDGGAAFAAGLSLIPDGKELAAAIGARGEYAVKTMLRLENVPMSEGFAELSEAKGFGAKLALLVREVFPTPAFMRWWKPLARRGPLGLATAYAWRFVWLTYRAIPGYLTWRRAARTPND